MPNDDDDDEPIVEEVLKCTSCGDDLDEVLICEECGNKYCPECINDHNCSGRPSPSTMTREELDKEMFDSDDNDV